MPVFDRSRCPAAVGFAPDLSSIMKPINLLQRPTPML
jgi:hypothetical protein